MAKSKSTSDSAIVWKARSQAAYQGYSHLSGIEMTSPLSMWNHSAFRTPRPCAAEERVRLVLLQPAVDVEVVVLLRPEHPGERLAVDPALVLAERAGRDPLVELVGVGEPLPERLLEGRAEGRSAGRAVGEAELDELDTRPPARRGRSAPRPSSRSSPGSPRPVSPATTYRWNASFTYGVGFGWPQSLSAFLSFSVNRSSGLAVAGERVLAQLGMGGHDRPALLAEDRLRRPRRPTTRCSGTTASGAGAAGPPPGRGCGPRPGSGCLPAPPWRTRGRRRSSGRRRRSPCRAARTRAPPATAAGSSRRGPGTGTRAAGTCRGTSCTSGSASSRRRSSTP